MKIVVDTNLVFSALISPSGTISDVLMNASNKTDFYAPRFLEDELSKYEDKMLKLSGLERMDLFELKKLVLRKIKLIDHELIAQETWTNAMTLTDDVDINDTPFVALTLELNGLLWTGDKKLINGLASKGIDWVIDTTMLKEMT